MAFDNNDLNSLSLLDYLDALNYSYQRHGSVITLVQHPDGHEMSSFTYNEEKNVWTWWARGINGYGAYDYIRKIEGITAPIDVFNRMRDVLGIADANRAAEVQSRIAGRAQRLAETQTEFIVEDYVDDGLFRLPAKSPNSNQLVQSLCGRRCIDREVLEFYMNQGLVYESNQKRVRKDGSVYWAHNAIFVAYDTDGTPRAASWKFLLPQIDPETGHEHYPGGSCKGSNKTQFLPCYFSGKSDLLTLFESVTDAMAYMTLLKRAGRAWSAMSFVSLEGVSATYTAVPPGLRNRLDQHPEINKIVFAFDNKSEDVAGVGATEALTTLLKPRYAVAPHVPPQLPCRYTHNKSGVTKDWADVLAEKVRGERAAEDIMTAGVRYVSAVWNAVGIGKNVEGTVENAPWDMLGNEDYAFWFEKGIADKLTDVHKRATVADDGKLGKVEERIGAVVAQLGDRFPRVQQWYAGAAETRKITE